MLKRFSVSLEEHLLEKLDNHISSRGYSNRSEAIRDLIRKQLSEEQLATPTTQAVAGVFLVYDHHSRTLPQKLMDLQHQHLLQIVSSTHVHLDHDNCLEVIILKGKAAKLQQIADRITSLKGVKLSRINIVPTGDSLTQLETHKLS